MSAVKRLARTALVGATAAALGGCASKLSGVGGTEAFACQAPIGAQCTSISGVFANANARANQATRPVSDTLWPPVAPPSLPAGTVRPASVTPATTPVEAFPGAKPAIAQTPVTGPPRSPARVVKLWIAPWEDADGDLHEASFVHVVIDTGRWLIERVRPAPYPRLDGVRPPAAPTPLSAPGASPTRLPAAPSADTTSSADTFPIEP